MTKTHLFSFTLFLMSFLAPIFNHAFADKGAAYTFEDVKYLYMKALSETDKLQDNNFKFEENRDFSGSHLASITLYASKDPSLALSIVEKVNDPIWSSKIHAILAKHFAETNQCEQALAHIEQAKNKEFLETTKTLERNLYTSVASKKIIQAYTLCDQVEDAENVLKLYYPSYSMTDRDRCYDAAIKSIIASTLYKSGKHELAQSYFFKAQTIAHFIKREDNKVCPLTLIAKNEIDAGLLEKSNKTINKITPPRARDVLLRRLAVKYAERNPKTGNYNTMIASPKNQDMSALEQQSVYGFMDDVQFIKIKLQKIDELAPDKRLEKLRDLRETLQNHNVNYGLILIGLAYHKYGETQQATLLLKGLITKFLGIHAYDMYFLKNKLQNAPNRWSVNYLNAALPAYLKVTGDTQTVLEVLKTIETQRDNFYTRSNEAYNRAYDFWYAWGALVGYSKLTGNGELEDKLKDLLLDQYDKDIVITYAIHFLMDLGNYTLAESLIEKVQSPQGRIHMYISLANHKLGLPEWYKLEREILNDELCVYSHPKTYKSHYTPFRCLQGGILNNLTPF